MSSGYNKGFGDYFNIDYSDKPSAYAAGAIYSTVEDLFLWNQSLNSEALVPKKYLDLLFTKHIENIGYGRYYGYGWELIEKEGIEKVVLFYREHKYNPEFYKSEQELIVIDYYMQEIQKMLLKFLN